MVVTTTGPEVLGTAPIPTFGVTLNWVCAVAVTVPGASSVSGDLRLEGPGFADRCGYPCTVSVPLPPPTVPGVIAPSPQLIVALKPAAVFPV